MGSEANGNGNADSDDVALFHGIYSWLVNSVLCLGIPVGNAGRAGRSYLLHAIILLKKAAHGAAFFYTLTPYVSY